MRVVSSEGHQSATAQTPQRIALQEPSGIGTEPASGSPFSENGVGHGGETPIHCHVGDLSHGAPPQVINRLAHETHAGRSLMGHTTPPTLTKLRQPPAH